MLDLDCTSCGVHVAMDEPDMMRSGAPNCGCGGTMTVRARRVSCQKPKKRKAPAATFKRLFSEHFAVGMAVEGYDMYSADAWCRMMGLDPRSEEGKARMDAAVKAPEVPLLRHGDVVIWDQKTATNYCKTL